MTDYFHFNEKHISASLLFSPRQGTPNENLRLKKCNFIVIFLTKFDFWSKSFET